MRFSGIFTITLAAALFAACTSGPVNIPGDLSAAEIIQRGQEASDRNRYKQSLQYYEALRERFPTDMESSCTADYEIAFIHYKQNQFDLAKEEFHALLARYDAQDSELLPSQYKVLAEIVLKTIAVKEERRGPKKKAAAPDTPPLPDAPEDAY